MLQQDLDSHEYQDHTAGQLRPRLIFHPKYITNLYPDRRQDKGRTADKGHRPDDIYMEKCEGDSHREGINTRRNRQRQHGLHIKARADLFLFVLPGFFDHA